MNIAFVLLTYNRDEPAGIERSIAALTSGLREAGHRCIVLAAGPAHPGDGDLVVRLGGLALPRPATEDDLRRALNGAADRVADAVADEVRGLLARHGTELVCWVDAVWGLGYLAPAPPSVRTALMVRVLRTDGPMHEALGKGPGAVLTNSPFLVEHATRAQLPTHGWHAVLNALLHPAEPVPDTVREQLRRHGPVRIVARAEPEKGIAELLRALPATPGRRVEIVLAEAAFEYWTGMQREVIHECRSVVAGRADVEILPALPWSGVQPFLAGASATVVSSTSPETFCNVAAEALSVGTPVVGYDLGHLPRLTGAAGVMVPLREGPHALWDAVLRLLGDPDAYARACRAAPGQVAEHTPLAAARAFLRATAPSR
ncbi:glycosyltransferase family 4 protein [Streptomyces sp. 4N509B]|uniref:glycosyltransferase family 4 protein n=1 Tax=Streptomyces sp. 4N509B TaxID=3457413 RepID=UPI003FD3D8D6